jgi:hypothetical protein
MIAVVFALLATAASPNSGSYRPSALQQRVDRSFSSIAIETSFKSARQKLREDRRDSCHQFAECEWLDAAKVRYTFWGDGPSNLWVVVKSIDARDFSKRAIGALGIGLARKRLSVLAAAKKFAPDLQFSCAKESRDQQSTGTICEGTLQPGWVTMNFDRKDDLIAVRLDGYHFT